jgi:maltooligosyltrehalose trehalohydrolase
LSLRVFAPRATSVDVLIGEERIPLTPRVGGYFELDAARLAPDVDYWLSLDGGPGLPDPRSEHQPLGIAGPSRRVDHGAFAWTDANFIPTPLAQGVVYELHVGTFSESGTFDGVVEHLDHLRQLGVTHVELMPICEFGGDRGWGYDGVNLFAPHHAYGGPHGLKRLIDACHARGLAVLIDVVYNHLGPRGNHLGRFGPYFTDHDTPWGAAVNLRHSGSDDVRRFFIDNALAWLESYHADGLRLDAVQAFDDDRAFPFLAELAHEVEQAAKRLGKRWELIAECDRADPRTTRSLREGGLGMSAQWSDDLQFSLHAFFTGERNGRLRDFGELQTLAHVLQRGFRHQGSFSRFRGRAHGHPFDRPAPECLLGYLQTHDQVGNRPRGERFGALVSRAALHQATALTLLAPFVPMLFQGEEWAASTPFFYFTDHRDPGLARDVREGREREYRSLGFDVSGAVDPESFEAFSRSRLRWNERSAPDHREMLEWYRALLGLRRERFAGRTLPVRVQCEPNEGWLLLDRGELAVAVCVADDPRELPWRNGGEVLLEHGGALLEGDRLRLGPHAVAVLT